MVDSMKDRLVQDLQKAKAEGTLRSSRIREIVRVAVAEAARELKAGATELQATARDAIGAVVEVLGQRGKETEEEIAASVEGVVEGLSHAQSEAIATTQAEIRQLQSKLDEQTQQMADTVGGALIEIETVSHQTSSSLRDKIQQSIRVLRERVELFPWQERYDQIKIQLAKLDDKLEERYGERYGEIKRRLEKARETAKVRYDQARAHTEATGVDPVQRRQTELEEKANDLGAAVARKEQQVKESLKEFWQNATQR